MAKKQEKRETESQWTKKVCEELRKCNALVFSLVAQRAGEAGWPDRYVCHKLWNGWLEFKGKATKLKQKQACMIRELNVRQPGSAFIIRPYEDSSSAKSNGGIIEDHRESLMLRFESPKDLLKKLFLLRKLLEGHWVHRATANGCRVTRIVDERVQVSLGDDSVAFWKLDDFEANWRKL